MFNFYRAWRRGALMVAMVDIAPSYADSGRARSNRYFLTAEPVFWIGWKFRLAGLLKYRSACIFQEWIAALFPVRNRTPRTRWGADKRWGARCPSGPIRPQSPQAFQASAAFPIRSIVSGQFARPDDLSMGN